MENITAHTAKENFQTTITSKNHILFADEPVDKGGNNLGPSPKELLAASLGSCTAITLKMYAQHKQWELQEVIIKVDLEWDSESQSSNFTKNIQLIGNLDDQQKERLLKIADRCPVHQILTHSITVTTNLKP